MNLEITKLTGDLAPYSKEIKFQVISILTKFVSFGFSSVFEKVEEGPIIRTYFFKPSDMSPLSRINGREEDIALSLNVESIMMKRELQYLTIGVPKAERTIIKFDSILFKMLTTEVVKSMTLHILMGQTPKGEELYADLATQPHLLIAGTTGSGKSIFTSQVICSLALLHAPSTLNFTLVDTKQLDLTLFDGLPHIGKVVRDIHGLRQTLLDLLDEVRLRTEAMSGLVRNIKEWNKNPLGSKYKYKILIIDEFADVLDSDKEYLSQLHPKMRPQPIDVLVKRLAQISRAAGVHLIVATQRPSVKIISGDIKTNFPARICFKLPSMQDSRVVLDENGAERLLGAGDYLYKMSGSDIVKRAHSAFVSVHDIANIINQSEDLRRQYIKD